MHEITSDAEWRGLILEELRALRTDFQHFQLEVVRSQGEAKGRQAIFAGAWGFAAALLVALAPIAWKALVK